MLITLKYIKIFKELRHVSILTDHLQGVGLYLAKVTEVSDFSEVQTYSLVMIC